MAPSVLEVWDVRDGSGRSLGRAAAMNWLVAWGVVLDTLGMAVPGRVAAERRGGRVTIRALGDGSYFEVIRAS